VPPVLLFAIVYHIECASIYYNTKNQVLKKAETEGYKSLVWAGLVLVGLILSGYLLILDRRKRNDRIIPITPTVKKIYIHTNGLGLRIY
jgi:hypothetical protein